MRWMTLAPPLLCAACAAAPPPPFAPTGPEGVWMLRSLAGAPVETPVSLTIEEGVAYGVAPCNRYRGGLRRDGATVLMGPMVATSAACRDLPLEQAYLSALTDVASMAVEDGALVLRDGAGATLMTLRPAGAPTARPAG